MRIATLNLNNRNPKKEESTKTTEIIQKVLDDSQSDILVLTEFNYNYQKLLTVLKDDLKFEIISIKEGDKDQKPDEHSVLIACKLLYKKVEIFPNELEKYHRIIKLTLNDDITLFGIYIPSTKGHCKEKVRLFDFLIKYINAPENRGEKIIITGDFNTSNPRDKEHKSEFADEFEEILNARYIDAWHEKHFKENGLMGIHYSYCKGKTKRRIDHFLVHHALKDKILCCKYNHETREGINKISDHSMMILELK